MVARASEQERLSIATLSNMQIHLPDGRTVPLLQVATIAHGQDFPIVRRRDRLATVTVQAEVRGGMQAETVAKTLAPKVASLNAQLPEDYVVTSGGSAEESAKSQESVAKVVPVMLVLILVILMVQLRSVQRMLLVLSVAPLGLIGVVLALLAS